MSLKTMGVLIEGIVWFLPLEQWGLEKGAISRVKLWRALQHPKHQWTLLASPTNHQVSHQPCALKQTTINRTHKWFVRKHSVKMIRFLAIITNDTGITCRGGCSVYVMGSFIPDLLAQTLNRVNQIGLWKNPKLEARKFKSWIRLWQHGVRSPNLG